MMQGLRKIIEEKVPATGREGGKRHQLRRQALAMLAADTGRLASNDAPSLELPVL